VFFILEAFLVIFVEIASHPLSNEYIKCPDTSGICCFRRLAVSLSNHEFGPDVLIGCPTCLSTYLLGCLLALILCTHLSFSQDLAALLLNLAGQSCVPGE
jgi:hypothetical protein